MGTLELSNLIQLEINENLRNISIPKKGVVFGVDGDIEVNRVAFVFPRYYSNFDMTEFSARVNYVNANGEANYYEADDMSSDDGDTATFSWLMTSDVTSYIGEVRFSVLLYKRLDERYVKKFGTRPATGRVLEGLDVESYVTPEQQLTLIEKMEKKFDAYVEAKMLSVNHGIEDAKNGALDVIEEAKNDVDSFIASSKSEIDSLLSSSLDDIKNLTDISKLNISTLTDEKLASLDEETVRQLKNIELAGVEETEKIRTAFSSAVSDIQTEGQKQADAVDSHGDSKIKEINDSTATSLANINSISEKQVEAIQLEGTKQTSSVNSEGNKQVSAVASAGATEVTKVKKASSTALSDIGSAKESSISEITAKGTEQVKTIKDTSASEISKVQEAGISQVKSVSDEGKIQIDGVKSEGEKQVQSVSAKGTQSLQDIDTAKTAAVKSVNDQTKPIIDKVEQLKQNVNDKSDSVDEAYEQMKKLHCIEISEKAPTNERAGLWVNPESNEEINIPEIKDEEVSGIDTWSSQKINHEIDSLKEDIVNNVDEIRNNGFVRMRRINLFDNSSDKLTNGRIYSDRKITGNGKTSDYIQIKPGRYIIYSTNKYEVFCTNVYDTGKNILRTYTNYTTMIVLEDGDCFVRISCTDSQLQSIMFISLDDYYYYALLDGGSIKYYAYDDLVTDDVYPGFEKSHKLFVEEVMEPLKAKHIEVFKDYGNINLLGKAIEGKYWHASSFKSFAANETWRCYPEIHLNLTAQGENYYVPVGGIYIDIWAIADAGIKKLGAISATQYATELRKFTISKTGVTEKYNSAGVKEADIKFDAEYDRVILLVSSTHKVSVLTKFKDVTEYCDSSYKRVEFADTCKKYLINQIVSESTAFSEQIKSLTRPLYGKTLIVFGDSEMQYLTDTAENIDMYKNLLSIDTYKSYAIAGNTWEANEGDTNAETCTTGIHGQLNRLFLDISKGVIDKENIGGIIWMMGTNGRKQGEFWETEGTSVNTDITCMCGAMNVFFNRILTNFTSTEIRLMGIIPIQGKGRNEYFGDKGLMVRHNFIRDAHRCWSIPFLDLQYEAEIPATTLLNCDNGTMGDVVHWSKLGMQIGIRKICGKLISV